MNPRQLKGPPTTPWPLGKRAAGAQKGAKRAPARAPDASSRGGKAQELHIEALEQRDGLGLMVIQWWFNGDIMVMHLYGSMYLSIYLSVCLSIYLSVCLSVCLSVYLNQIH